jgi:hypothetical protein
MFISYTQAVDDASLSSDITETEAETDDEVDSVLERRRLRR